MKLSHKLSSLLFLLISALFIVLKFLDDFEFFLDLLLKMCKQGTVNKGPSSILKISNLRINLTPLGSTVLGCFKHGSSGRFSRLSFEIFGFHKEVAIAIFVNFLDSFHLLYLQISLF